MSPRPESKYKTRSRSPTVDEAERRVSLKVTKNSTPGSNIDHRFILQPPLFPRLRGTFEKSQQSQAWILNESNETNLLASQSNSAYEICLKASQVAITSCSLPLSLQSMHLDLDAKTAINQLGSEIGTKTVEAISAVKFTEFKQHWCQQIAGLYLTPSDITILADHVTALKKWWWGGGLSTGNYSIVSGVEEVHAQARELYKLDASAYRKMVVSKGLQLERKNFYEALLFVLE